MAAFKSAFRPSGMEKVQSREAEKIRIREAEMAKCLTFCRDSITRLADGKHTLPREKLEDLLTEKVRDKTCILLCAAAISTQQ